MSRKSMNDKIIECIKGRAEEKAREQRYEEDNYTDKDLHPDHPDNN